MNKIRKTSAEWIKEYSYEIIDADGWRPNFDYSFYQEKITRKEFEVRLFLSTVRKKFK